MSDPALTAEQREQRVRELMAARRTVRAAKCDPAAVKHARAAVDAAKIALGERGPVWWSAGAPDHNRQMVVTTPYAAWYASLPAAAEE